LFLLSSQKRQFPPQISQINADFQPVADVSLLTRQAGRQFKVTFSLIGENLRNLRTTAFSGIIALAGMTNFKGAFNR